MTAVICTRNFLDSEYLPCYITGGSWSMPLSNLMTDNISTEVARSSGATTANTKFEVSLRELKEITLSVIPKHNLGRTGLYRVRYSDTIAWENATVSTSAIIGATSFTLLAGATSAALVSGQYIKFENDDQEYKITTTATVAPAGTQTVNITPALAVALTGGDTIECLSGDYSSAVYDSGWSDAIPMVYPYLYPYWGHPSFWDGKPTAEEISRETYPIIIVHDSYILAQYQLWEFDDTTNADGYLEMPRLFVGNGVQPTFNANWGSSQGLRSSTSVKETLNGRRAYDRRPTVRVFDLTFTDLPENEVYSYFFDDLRQQGKHGQMFIVFDPNDIAHLHRRSMLCTVEELPAISYDYHGGGINGDTYTAVSLTFRFTEVVA